MIKIESKKSHNIITKDGNKLGSRKKYQVNKFEFENKITPGITLYFNSIEELELYKNDKIWCIGCPVKEDEEKGVFIISYEYKGFFLDPTLNIKQALYLMDMYHSENNNKKYILLKSENENLFIPNIEF